MLVALKLRFGQNPEPDDTRVLIAPSITDNRGNGAAPNKLMSTRFPSSAVLMELATYMKARGMRAVVEWAPRECNNEADLLANGITDQFDTERRIPVSAQSLVWNILPEALKAGREAEQAYVRLKETHGLPVRNPVVRAFGAIRQKALSILRRSLSRVALLSRLCFSSSSLVLGLPRYLHVSPIFKLPIHRVSCHWEVGFIVLTPA